MFLFFIISFQCSSLAVITSDTADSATPPQLMSVCSQFHICGPYRPNERLANLNTISLNDFVFSRRKQKGLVNSSNLTANFLCGEENTKFSRTSINFCRHRLFRATAIIMLNRQTGHNFLLMFNYKFSFLEEIVFQTNGRWRGFMLSAVPKSLAYFWSV